MNSIYNAITKTKQNTVISDEIDTEEQTKVINAAQTTPRLKKIIGEPLKRVSKHLQDNEV